MNKTIPWIKDSIRRIEKCRYENSRMLAKMIAVEVSGLFAKKGTHKGIPGFNEVTGDSPPPRKGIRIDKMSKQNLKAFGIG